MSSLRVTIGRGLGFVAVACTLALSLPGIEAVRADEAAPPDASVSPNASYEGFAEHLARKERAASVEQAGPTCNARSPHAAEMTHQRMLAQLKARMLAEARARAAAGETSPNIVVLNGSGYNYRAPEPGMRPTPEPGAPTN